MDNFDDVKQGLSEAVRNKLNELLERREKTEQQFINFRKDYTIAKTTVNKTRKKMETVERSLTESDCWSSISMHNLIKSIENKYEIIDKSIRNYKTINRRFEKNWPLLKKYSYYKDHTFESEINRLISLNSQSNIYMAAARNGLRITERYFKNIQQQFDSYKMFREMKKEHAIIRAKRVKAETLPEVLSIP